MFSKIALVSLLLGAAQAQQAGTSTKETHPSMTWQKCTAPGSCTTVTGKVVLDSNWRWVHDAKAGAYKNCYDGNTWDKTLCPDNVACAKNCALDGADYSGTYGATISGNSMKLNFVTSKNVGSRMYMMADDKTYQQYYMLGQEFTFDVDVSKLPCGLNGALYMVNMPKDGGLSSTNKAGAAYGTGYCDAQCPRDLKFIDGKANVEGWTPQSNSANSGTGGNGACCAEMDIWEANSISTAVTPHAGPSKLTVCKGDSCGGTYSNDRYSGNTDPDGCDFNSYRQGDTTFYGPGMTVDTTKPFTVVTQFITDDGTTNGNLKEIKRFYVQGGKVIPNSENKIAGLTGNSITEDYCKNQPTVFNNTPSFNNKGGLKSMSDGLKAGMTLVLSLWDDYADSMLWLDSNNPTTGDASQPGVARGTCATTSGLPSDVESSASSASVTYSNIKVGPINSTFAAPKSKREAMEQVAGRAKAM